MSRPAATEPTRRPSRLQTRLLIAVATLAMAAILLVALAARQGARREFLRFADLQRSEIDARLPFFWRDAGGFHIGHFGRLVHGISP